MANSAPVITFTDTSNNALSSLSLTGTGNTGTIPIGTLSNTLTIRVWNNQANAANIADAIQTTLYVSDSSSSISATSAITTGTWIQVEVLDYSGNTTNADSSALPIGGTQGHTIPVNLGTIAGSAPNYVTVALSANVPATATGAQMQVYFAVQCSYNL